MKLLLIAISCLTVFAADPPKEDPPKPAEKHLTAEQRAQFWRRSSDTVAAIAAAKEAQAKMDATIAELKAFCSGDLALDAKGEPDCQQPKAEPSSK